VFLLSFPPPLPSSSPTPFLPLPLNQLGRVGEAPPAEFGAFRAVRKPLVAIILSIAWNEQEVKVIRQKAPHWGPIPRLGVTPGGRNLYH